MRLASNQKFTKFFNEANLLIIISGNQYVQLTKEGPHRLVEYDVTEALGSRPSIQQAFVHTHVNYSFVIFIVAP